MSAPTMTTYRITASISFDVDVVAPDPEAALRWFWGQSDPIASMREGELRVDDVMPATEEPEPRATVDSKGEEV
jgi:hypothetical protein